MDIMKPQKEKEIPKKDQIKMFIELFKDEIVESLNKKKEIKIWTIKNDLCLLFWIKQ